MAVLEIGCGTGLFLAYLHHKGVRDFVGIDHDPNLKDVIPPEVADRFRLTDVREFLERQAGKRRFDRIAMFDVLEHFSVDEGREMLGKILDILARDGKIIIKVPNASSPWGRQFQYGDLTHKVAYTPESLRQLATASGYVCTSCFPHYLGSPSRRVLDRLLHGLVGRMVMTPPEIWTANFFAVLGPE